MGNICYGELGPAPVTLQIYDAGGTEVVKNVNKLLRAVGTGAFHTGVEVYGKEWSFGFTSDGSSGIFSCPPRCCKTHAYRESVHLGETELSQLDVEALLSELSSQWRGGHYDVLRRNCTHFSEELCRCLGVGPVPAWVGNIALAGRTVDIGMQRVASFRSVKSCATVSVAGQKPQARRIKLKKEDDVAGLVDRGGKEIDTCSLAQELFGSIKTVQSVQSMHDACLSSPRSFKDSKSL
uniref:PPPDE domain-containing protein n=1 Tax=Alexandrium monilatum TaxID=311494 RepID=A0A6T0WDF2_9DINO|mmetsp:Transcript_37692/g.112509  ORF Transcript_37692/g.112509 Transcript_37692/m.112509 type:complete len:237 (-) Transcript_37692:44-754(-)